MGFAQVSGAVSDGTGPQLDYHALRLANRKPPEFLEKGMVCDFSFASWDLPADQSLVSQNVPVQLDTAGKTMSLQDNSAGKYLHLAAGARNGLLTPFADAREWTYGGLFMLEPPQPTTAYHIFAGTATSLSAEGGEFLFASPSRGIGVGVRGYSANINAASLAQLVAQGFSDTSTSTMVFAAVTSKLTGNVSAPTETTHILFVGAPAPLIMSGTGIKTLSTAQKRLSIGNAHSAAANFDDIPIRCGRFFAGAGSRTVEELTAMYKRAKVIGARRGLNVF